MTNYLVSENVNAGIEILAIYAVAPSCWKSFFLLLTLNNKCTRISPTYLSECIKKEDGFNYS